MDLQRYGGWIVAGVTILWALFTINLNMRMDWLSFGADYRATLQQIAGRFEQTDHSMTELKQRLETLERSQHALSGEK